MSYNVVTFFPIFSTVFEISVAILRRKSYPGGNERLQIDKRQTESWSSNEHDWREAQIQTHYSRGWSNVSGD